MDSPQQTKGIGSGAALTSLDFLPHIIADRLRHHGDIRHTLGIESIGTGIGLTERIGNN